MAEEILSAARQARMEFLEYQAAQQIVQMHQTAAAAADASFDLAQRLHKAGNLTDLALLDEQAEYSRAKLDLAAAEMRLTERREHLNRLMGLWGQDVNWKIDSQLAEVPAQEMALENLESTVVEKSLDLESLRRRIFAARERLGLGRITGLVPDIEVGVSARNVENRWITGPMFEIPLPVFNQGQGKNAEAMAELRRARQEYIAVAIDLRSEVREAQARLMSARDRAVYYERVMLPLAHRIVEEAQKNYNAMLASPLQLLDARQREVSAQSEHVRNVLDYWGARSDLEQLLNGARPGHEQSRYFEHMNRGMFGESGSATGVH